MAERFRLTPLEVASGYVLGTDVHAPHLPASVHEKPIEAFEAAIREALLRPPCAVAFSGGRDSSAVLAVATDVARREGLQPPVPLTLIFPESAESDETVWQERVIRHLRLDDWVRREVVDELDCVGPYATSALVRAGLYWPANAHVHLLLMEEVRGGALVTGDGGDQALLTPNWGGRLADLVSREARPSPRDVLRVGFALSPGPVRRAVLRRRRPHPVHCPWLQPAALSELEQQIWAYEAEEPLRLDRRLEWAARLRPIRIALAAFDRFAAEAGATLVQPFHDPAFQAALAAAAGTRGRLGDRTDTMRWLFSGVLPDDVCARPTKGGFRDVFWNRHSRAFAERWQGEGADPELVDVAALQALWRSPDAREHFRSATQLQAAWLARHRANANGSAGEGLEQAAERVAE